MSETATAVVLEILGRLIAALAASGLIDRAKVLELAEIARRYARE